MTNFEGFPTRMQFTPIPNVFIGKLLPEITDAGELKTIIFAFAKIYQKKGFPQFVSLSELLGSTPLISSLNNNDSNTEDTLLGYLKQASERGVFISVNMAHNGNPETVYLLNTEVNRDAATKIAGGEIILKELVVAATEYAEAEELPNIFALYEQNIGIITPMIADELREAEKTYPPEWLGEAFKEASLRNKRNIKYILKILENWTAEGKNDGTSRRNSEEDPDKYIRGKYGHMVQR